MDPSHASSAPPLKDTDIPQLSLAKRNFSRWLFIVEPRFRVRGVWDIMNGIETAPEPGELGISAAERSRRQLALSDYETRRHLACFMLTTAVSHDDDLISSLLSIPNNDPGALFAAIKRIFHSTSALAQVNANGELSNCINDKAEDIRTFLSRFGDIVARIRGSGQDFTDSAYKTALAKAAAHGHPSLMIQLLGYAEPQAGYDLHRFKEKVIELYTATVAASSIAATNVSARSESKSATALQASVKELRSTGRGRGPNHRGRGRGRFSGRNPGRGSPPTTRQIVCYACNGNGHTRNECPTHLRSKEKGHLGKRKASAMEDQA